MPFGDVDNQLPNDKASPVACNAALSSGIAKRPSACAAGRASSRCSVSSGNEEAGEGEESAEGEIPAKIEQKKKLLVRTRLKELEPNSPM